MKKALSAEAAYILHKRPYRETSLLVDFFSLEHGRISAVWRAARGAKKRVKSEPFQAMRIHCIGSRELKTVTSAEPQSVAAGMLTGKNLYTGLYINELLYRLLAPHDTHEEIFRAYEHMLDVLRLGRNVEAHLRHFELHLLAALGYGIVFDCEADGDTPISADNMYRYTAGEGFYRQAGGTEQSILGAKLNAIASGDWQAPGVLAHLKTITETALNAQLHGKTLRSKEYFRGQKKLNC